MLNAVSLFSDMIFFKFQLKVDLPGVTVECSSPWRIELDGPQNHVWTIHVQIQVESVIHVLYIAVYEMPLFNGAVS